ncbi:TetR/AcrR family transcriptional regulator [Acinetobacter sp. AYS6]|uniref:TetR/AcrR family transcriptional regulator n=1 Tax=Acinetobacter TaxID=469 RepID=UPI00029C9723|nr:MULTISPECIES: TetR/AcrR family transcriptional regulator [Acinetobacter]EKU38481.1 transcriptional regulator, TetR family [Acinetobacter sp. WC-141]MBM7140228.1 TetR/AcrR family transcriptional regulator [Acinetobacter sp. 105-3]MCU7698156.1 TetR/AcrR family transcriptional regulator [Acinetobacter sp. AYS6]
MTKRENIITTATSLFNQKSYTSVGVDKIIAESNVAKMTFYKYFSSKENLIEVCLHERNLEIQSSIFEKINNINNPLIKIKSIFNWYIDWINTDDFNGCLFKKATIEVLQMYPSVKDQVNEYRDWIYKLVFSTFLELEIKDAHTLTSLFLNIIDGIIIDGTINKTKINSEQTWSYINKLINFEATQAYAAA